MRLKTAVALTCAAVLVLAGCSRKGSSTHTLAFVTNNASDFWTIARKGMEKADAERADITVEFRLGDGYGCRTEADRGGSARPKVWTASPSVRSIPPTRPQCSTMPPRGRWCSRTTAMRQPASASATSAPTTSRPDGRPAN